MKIKKDSRGCVVKYYKEKEKVRSVSVSLCYCLPGLLQLEPARLIKLTRSTLYDGWKRLIWVVTIGYWGVAYAGEHLYNHRLGNIRHTHMGRSYTLLSCVFMQMLSHSVCLTGTFPSYAVAGWRMGRHKCATFRGFIKIMLTSMPHNIIPGILPPLM